MKLLFSIPAIAALLMGSVAMAEEPKVDEPTEQFVPGILKPLKLEKEKRVVGKEPATLWLFYKVKAGIYTGIGGTFEMKDFQTCLIALNNIQQQYNIAPATKAFCLGKQTGRVDSIKFGNKPKSASFDLGIPLKQILDKKK